MHNAWTTAAGQPHVPGADSQQERQGQPRGRVPDHGAKARDDYNFRPVEQKKHQHERNGKKNMAKDDPRFMHERVSFNHLFNAVSRAPHSVAFVCESVRFIQTDHNSVAASSLRFV